MKQLLKTFVLLIMVILLVVGGYVGYVAIQYHRVENPLDLDIENSQTAVIEDRAYTVVTYNIGFGAYTPDFSFFMDSGEMLDGTKVSGVYAKAKDAETVLLNTEGAIEVVDELDPDFIMFQEVDIRATRSRHINQYAMIQEHFTSMSSSFATNFNSAYLLYPFNDPIGKSHSGIAIFSKLNIASTTRHRFPVTESFFAKFFDLDRCFTVSRIPVDDKELVLINVHMSAYDEGGLIRAQQLDVLNAMLQAEYQKGNFIIAGGDFNHDIADSINHFPTEQKVPEWVFVLEEGQLAPNFSFATSLNGPTCRSTDIPYQEGVNYTVVIDGFIVSNNIIVENVTNIISLSQYTSFLYSDHNPVKLTFRLNR